jgi:hypothetical protein
VSVDATGCGTCLVRLAVKVFDRDWLMESVYCRLAADAYGRPVSVVAKQ